MGPQDQGALPGAARGRRSARLLLVVAPHAPALLAAAAGVAWLVLHVGASVLDPTRVDWVMGGDVGASYFGWTFFRLAPLALPLGANPSYPFGVGSTLGLSDSIPLVGVLLRPFSGVLPERFQYVGPWLGACFALQGFVGAKLVKLVTTRADAQALGGALFALAPPLLHRFVGPNTLHASLSAHWLVLAFLWLALAPVDAAHVRRRVAAAAALLVVAAGVHPYHVLAGLVLCGGLAVRLWAVDRAVGPRGFALSAAALAAAGFGGLLAFGYFGAGAGTPTGGFGFFSADGLALVNPAGWSRFFSGFPAGHGQYEGFGYLGAGVLGLLAVAAVAASLNRERLAAARWRSALPVLGAAVLLAVLALSDTVTLAGSTVARIGVYRWFPAFGEIFRSTGRFVWSLHYVILFSGVAALVVAWRERPRVAAAALAAAVALQVADVRPPVPLDLDRLGRPTLKSDAWSLARGAYRHVAMVPPYLFANGHRVVPGKCDPLWPRDAQAPVADVAYRLSATFNSGYLGRLDPAAAAAACDALGRGLVAGRLDPDTIHVVHPKYWRFLRTAGATCGVMDDFVVCVDGSRRDPFARALALAPVTPARGPLR